VKRLLMLLSLLGLLLFLATPALGDHRGGRQVKFHHVEPNTPVQVERIFKSGGKLYAVAVPDPLVMIVIAPNDAIKYVTWKSEKTLVTRPVDARVIAQVWRQHGSWTAYADGKTYHGFKSRERAMAKAMGAVMDQIDALEDVPDTGGINLRVIALAGIALLIGGSLLRRRIVSW
jgi:LPXTG-motif cell wall-anchored protein